MDSILNVEEFLMLFFFSIPMDDGNGIVEER